MSNETEKFSFSTIKEFDSHIEKSIPGYNNLIDLTIKLTSFSIPEYISRPVCNGIDLGCSTGKLIEALSEKYIDAVFEGFEIDANMINQSNRPDLIRNIDIVNDCWSVSYVDIIYSIFFLQFLNSPTDRQHVLDTAYKSLRKGGAMIVAEKVVADDPFLERMLTFTHYEHKLKSFSAEEILSKEQDLRRIMFPLLQKDVLGQFFSAGFSTVKPIWQNGQFQAWLLIK